MIVIRAETHILLLRIANREDTDQIAWVCPVCLGPLDRQLVFESLENLSFIKAGFPAAK